MATPHSSRAGGFTFPEDPARSCASVRPVWSANVDPRVLTACARPTTAKGDKSIPVDLRKLAARAVFDAAGEHIRIDHVGRSARLDVVGGTALTGPTPLVVEIALGSNLAAQLDALRELRLLLAGKAGRARLSRDLYNRLRALHAYDARANGLSLHAITDRLLGPGDWPGDGDHRKSQVRRLIAKGAALVRAGPRNILR